MPSKETMGSTECVLNYRLSRARRVVENAFDVLVYARFRVHNRIMDQRPETVDKSIKRNMRASQHAAENAKFSAIVSG